MVAHTPRDAFFNGARDMAADIQILVGTMTGTAELCAEEMCDALEEAGHLAEMILMDDLEANIFDPASAYIICTSTYGHGDVPDNAKKLYDSLQSTNQIWKVCATAFLRSAILPTEKPSAGRDKL